MRGFLFQGLAFGALVARMPVQSTYSETIRPALAGMRANEEPVVLISRNVEPAGGLGFGVPVVQGTRDEGVRGTQAGDTKILGITLRTRDRRPETPNGYGQYEAAPIMTKGVIWVMTAGAVAAGADVTVAVATGAFDDTAVAAGIVAIPGARWDSSTTGAGLAKIRLG